MSLTRNRLYRYLLLACLASYVWLALIGRLEPQEAAASYDFCVIHHFLHFPCPSCGSTRSVLALLHGDLAAALYWNPLGFLIVAALAVIPIWIGFDQVLKKDTLFRFYHEFERRMQQRWVAIPVIMLLLLNWAWNIYKNV